MSKPAQEWHLEVGGQVHRVSAREASWTQREIIWRLDGVIVASKRSSEEKVVLRPGDAIRDDAALAPDPSVAVDAGAVRVIFSSLGSPRRAIWFEGTEALAAAHAGLGGVDFEPEAGSPLAVREERAAKNPRLYAARHVLLGVAKVALPILGVWLLAQLAGLLPDVSIDLPNIPWPDLDLPSIPWPDINLPSIPWPDWQAPFWLRWILDNAKFVLPILLGIALARNEIRRRASQPAKRAELRERAADRSASGQWDGSPEA